jgi:hypothetical protein
MRPHRQLGSHMTGRNFSRLQRRDASRAQSEDSSSERDSSQLLRKFKVKHGPLTSLESLQAKKRKASLRGRDRASPSPQSVDSNPDPRTPGGGGSSSGSGTVGGIARIGTCSIRFDTLAGSVCRSRNVPSIFFCFGPKMPCDAPRLY